MMKKLNISQVDVLFSNGNYPIEFLLYYKNRLNSNNIRAALKTLSKTFWPLFGRYHQGTIQFDHYVEERHFDESEVDQLFEQDEPAITLYEKYRTAVSVDVDTLFFLKIIRYRNGTILIPKMNHLAGDGYSYFYFLTALAALSRVSLIPFKRYVLRRLYMPHHQRTILKSFQSKVIDVPSPRVPGTLIIEFERIPRDELRNTLKEGAVTFEQAVSSNDFLSARIVKQFIGLRKDYFGETFELTMPMDVRRQIREWGPTFFGNGIMFKRIEFKTADLENLSIYELALRIRASMPTVSRENFMVFLESLEHLIETGHPGQLKPYNPESGSLVTNLTKLPVNRLDFGEGWADFIFPLTIEKNSTAILADEDDYILRIAY